MPLSIHTFSLLTPLLLMLLGAGQVSLWLRWKSQRELLWLGLALAAVSVGIAIQLLWRPAEFFFFVMAFTVFYLLGFVGIGKALAHRMRVPFAPKAVVALSVLCLLLQTWFSTQAPNLPVRVLVLNVIAMGLVGLPLLYWRRMQLRNRYDTYLRWLYLSFVVINAVRLALTLPVSQVQDPYEFTETWFWMTVHIACMAVCMLAAACMFFAVFQDELDQLHKERNTDALTGALNRRGWAWAIEQLEQRPVSAGAGLCTALLVDVDYFKQINDAYGHDAGEAVLQEIAKTLRRQVGTNDLVCRYGGEEFAVLLTSADLAAAQQVAERMREQVQAIRMPCVQDTPVTVSIGLAAVQAVSVAAVQAAITAADVQMYAAKKAGRNRIALANTHLAQDVALLS